MPSHDTTSDPVSVTINDQGFMGPRGGSTFTVKIGQAVNFINSVGRSTAITIIFKSGVLTGGDGMEKGGFTSFTLRDSDQSWSVGAGNEVGSNHAITAEWEGDHTTPKTGTLNVGSGGSPFP